MNQRTSQILGMGAFFAGIVIIVDVFLAQIPTLAWAALGFVFFLAAASILTLVAQTVPDLASKPTKDKRPKDEFQHLVHTVDAGVFGHDLGALGIVSDRIKSLAVGSIATRLRLSKKEVLELAENDPQELRLMVNDDDLIKLLIPRRNPNDEPTRIELEKALVSLERWSS